MQASLAGSAAFPFGEPAARAVFEQAGIELQESQ